MLADADFQLLEAQNTQGEVCLKRASQQILWGHFETFHIRGWMLNTFGLLTTSQWLLVLFSCSNVRITCPPSTTRKRAVPNDG